MNRMRRHLTAFYFQILFVIPFTCAHGSELPSDVLNLFEKREEAVRAIDRRLVDELERLKLVYTKRGDLDTANAIVAEIQKVASVQISRLAGAWKRDLDGIIWTFDGKGGGLIGKSERFTVVYDSEKKNFRIMTEKWTNTVSYGSDLSTLDGDTLDGRTYKLKRIK